MATHNRIDYPVEQIRQWIEEGHTQTEIAETLAEVLDSRVTAKLVYKVCKRNGIQCQRTGPRSGVGHPYWSGGRRQTKNGYVEVYLPEHPSCVEKNRKRAAKAGGKFFRKQVYVREHRLVMEEHIGRYLEPKEVVHHRNGDTADNRIENLELFESNAAHLKATLKGQCPKWTDEGKLHLRAANRARSYIHRIYKERGVTLPPQTKFRELFEREIGPDWLSQMADELRQEQAAAH